MPTGPQKAVKTSRKSTVRHAEGQRKCSLVFDRKTVRNLVPFSKTTSGCVHNFDTFPQSLISYFLEPWITGYDQNKYSLPPRRKTRVLQVTKTAENSNFWILAKTGTHVPDIEKYYINANGPQKVVKISRKSTVCRAEGQQKFPLVFDPKILLNLVPCS